jgi:rhodanese-related sulfurtransferase
MTADYLLLAVVAGYFAWRVINSFLVRRRLPSLLKEGAQLVDVRGRGEFAAGHAANSINIPLPEIGERAGDLDRSRPVIVCCASGTRSAMAAHRLRRLGFGRVVNAGSWRSLR